jgi:hypothetical protein
LRCRAARPRTFSPCATSRFISEAATLGTLDCDRRALLIINTLIFAVAVAEIEFGQIAMQVRFANVLICPVNAAL